MDVIRYVGFAVIAVILVYVVLFGTLFLRFIVGINFERGGWWNVLVPLAIRAGWLDIKLNYTLFALAIWSKPRDGETTISKHMKRLVYWQNRRGAICRFTAKYFINPWDKVGDAHIPLPPDA